MADQKESFVDKIKKIPVWAWIVAGTAVAGGTTVGALAGAGVIGGSSSQTQTTNLRLSNDSDSSLSLLNSLTQPVESLQIVKSSEECEILVYDDDFQTNYWTNRDQCLGLFTMNGQYLFNGSVQNQSVKTSHACWVFSLPFDFDFTGDILLKAWIY